MKRWLKRSPKPGPSPSRGAPSPSPSQAPRRKVDWRAWDPVAADYARAVAPHTVQAYGPLLDLLQPAEGARVLDLGCGTGRGTAEVLTRNLRGYGCDPAPAMLAQAHAWRTDLPVTAADTINLPFRDETFDAVAAAFVLHLAPKLETALFDVKRVLRRGGVIGVATWDTGEDDLTRTWRDLVESTLGPELYRDARREAEPHADRLADRARLETVLRDAGFRPVRVERAKLRLTMSLEDYVTAKEVEPMGRFLRSMLGARWDDFRTRVRSAYAERFGEQVLDFRDILLASGTKP